MTRGRSFWRKKNQRDGPFGVKKAKRTVPLSQKKPKEPSPCHKTMSVSISPNLHSKLRQGLSVSVHLLIFFRAKSKTVEGLPRLIRL